MNKLKKGILAILLLISSSIAVGQVALTTGNVQTVTGAKTFNDSTLKLNGSTSGTGILKAPAAASTYIWTLPAATSTLMQNPLTTGGDLLYGGASGLPTRLANGTAGQVLTSAGTTLAPTWSTVSSTPSLTSTYIGYGNGSNALTGTSDLIYDTTNKRMSITNSTIVTRLGSAYVGNSSDHNFTIKANGNDRIVIDTNKGYVGIGVQGSGSYYQTHAPSYALEVQDSASRNTLMHFASNCNVDTECGGGYLASTAGAHAMIGGGVSMNTAGFWVARNASPSFMEFNGGITFYVDGGKSVGSTYTPTAQASISSSGVVSDVKGDVRILPQNSQSAAYTTVLLDSGKHILHPSADTTARTFTIAANASVAYPIGTMLTIVNQDSAGVLTVAITSDTMRLAGAGTTGSRTMAANCVATALKITATEWIISGGSCLTFNDVGLPFYAANDAVYAKAA